MATKQPKPGTDARETEHGRYTYGEGGTSERFALTTCPACGHEFGPTENRPYHFEQEHTPEDFGL